MTSTAKLIAIVEVDQADRVQCQESGCGHGVYKRIHVVQDGSRIQVLGSTCFEKRYGSPGALGDSRHGGGAGRKLTSEERQLLIQNTAALIERFEEEKAEIERQRVALENQKNELENRRLANIEAGRLELQRRDDEAKARVAAARAAALKSPVYAPQWNSISELKAAGVTVSS